MSTNTLKFKCYHCLHCCFFVKTEETPLVLKDEVTFLNLEALKRGIKLEFVRLDDKFFKWLITGFCPFYNIRYRRCTIHEVKPLSCKMFPLLLNIKTKDIHVSTACDWVLHHLDELLEGDIDVEEVFEEEIYAVRKLSKNLFT